MNEINMYLLQILEKYQPRDLTPHFKDIILLHDRLRSWASSCYIEILESGSRAKGTAISVASDVDYLISLSSNCNENRGGLKSIYDSLYSTLTFFRYQVRQQNVSFRINLNRLEVDITPARKHSREVNYYSLYVSKEDTWKQTNIQKHITDISSSGRTNEIKILKIWRWINKLEFPSIYLEYLIVNNILWNKYFTSLEESVWYILNELAKKENNPLFEKIIDPANSNNILSSLLTMNEKMKIISKAQIGITRKHWNDIIA